MSDVWKCSARYPGAQEREIDHSWRCCAQVLPKQTRMMRRSRKSYKDMLDSLEAAVTVYNQVEQMR